MADDDDLTEVFERYPTLAGVSRFAQLIGRVPWFRAVGDPLDAPTRQDARRYLAALGFPDAEPALVPLWEDAAVAAESVDWNSPAWEAEEQLRAAVTADALELVDEAALELVATHLAGVAGEAATAGAIEASEFLQIDDEAFVRAAAGAAVQACHNAGLVLAAGGPGDLDADHPFSLKFQLFEAGRWPLGLIGLSFNIF